MGTEKRYKSSLLRNSEIYLFPWQYKFTPYMITSQSDSNLIVVLCNMYSWLHNTPYALCAGGEGAGGKGRSKKWQEYLELPTPHEALPLKKEIGKCGVCVCVCACVCVHVCVCTCICGVCACVCVCVCV